jgi:23S rRNA (guanosine2251-2'-O)-methyltransferase
MPKREWKPDWKRRAAGKPDRGPLPRPTSGQVPGQHANAPDGSVILYGWHPVKAALENPARRIRRLLATENALRRLTEDHVPLRVEPELVRPNAIAQRLSPDALHQGLLVEADPLPSPELEDIAPAGIVLVLDQITDPHNVGAIARSAAAFAVSALVTTARHSPEATGVLAKSASGALEYVPLVTVQNLARALAALKERGYLVVGLDSSGDVDFASSRSRLAIRSPAWTCPARSRASMSRTPRRLLSISRASAWPWPDLSRLPVARIAEVAAALLPMPVARHRDGARPEAVTIDDAVFAPLEDLEMVRSRRQHAHPIPMIDVMPVGIRIGPAVIGTEVARIIAVADIREVRRRRLTFIHRLGIEAGPRIDRALVHHIRRRKPPDLDLRRRRAVIPAPAAA